MDVSWKTYRVGSDEGTWEAASYNIRTAGRRPRVWPVAQSAAQASARPDGDFSLQGSTGPGMENRRQGISARRRGLYSRRAYYDTQGRVVAGPRTFMFNAPGAVHGGLSCDLILYIHCCSGEPDEIVSIDLIDFEPREQPPVVQGIPNLRHG